MLEFFFENPILTIIIIAVLSSFFRRKKDERERGHAPNKPVKGYEPRPQNRSFEEARDILKELSRTLQEQSPAKPKTMKKPLQPAEKEKTVLSELKEPASAASMPQKMASDSPASEPKAVSDEAKQEKSGEMQLEWRKQQFINGIIWSEILGLPRAKKPYMRKNIRS